MAKPRLTVGSLRGIPQHRVTRSGVLPPVPPARRGKGCCKRMCAGCPWAEAQRARLRQR